MGWDPLSVEELTELRAPSSKYKVVKDEGWPKKKREKRNSMEKGMAADSSIISWEIPGTEEPGGLQGK